MMTPDAYASNSDSPRSGHNAMIAWNIFLPNVVATTALLMMNTAPESFMSGMMFELHR